MRGTKELMIRMLPNLHCGCCLAIIIELAAHPSSAEPIQLTSGPGNDTEAAWSPDGKRIVFQSDRSGTLDLYLLDLDTLRVSSLTKTPGHACFPAWSPDGERIVYSYAHFAKTAFEGQPDGYNLFTIPAQGGAPRRLTRGLCRDYSPAFTSDGEAILFSSDRQGKTNAVSLFTVSTDGGEPRPVLLNEGRDTAAVQTDLSADGKCLAYGFISGFRANWAIRVAKVSDPGGWCPLTETAAAFYGPRWSPKAPVLACTGYEADDPGWNVWLIHAKTGDRLRVTAGPGNSRSPNWSGDGTELVYENNQSGLYKLYRVRAPAVPASPRVAPQAASRAVLHFSFAERPGRTVQDLSGRGNTGHVQGAPSWEDGAASFASQGAYVAVPKPTGCDFGAESFSVKATVLIRSQVDDLAMICVGDYPGNRRGWQLYLAKNHRVYFNSRTPDLKYRGAISDAPLPTNRLVTLVGIRHKSGLVQLLINGTLQRRPATDAVRSYGQPTQVRVGRQFDGTAPFPGWIHDVAVYEGTLSMAQLRREALARFWAE